MDEMAQRVSDVGRFDRYEKTKNWTMQVWSPELSRVIAKGVSEALASSPTAVLAIEKAIRDDGVCVVYQSVLEPPTEKDAAPTVLASFNFSYPVPPCGCPHYPGRPTWCNPCP